MYHVVYGAIVLDGVPLNMENTGNLKSIYPEVWVSGSIYS